jgi:hypothetical protein
VGGKDLQRVVGLAQVHRLFHSTLRLHGSGPSPAAAFGPPGFILPLASLTALALMLSSLSLLSLALQGRLRLAAEQQLLQSEDLGASIAQDLVARVQLHHACLLSRPLERWMEGECATSAELEALRTGVLDGQRWELQRWEPDLTSTASGSTVDLQVALQPRGPSPALLAAFSLRLAGEPARVRDLRLRGWIGRV